MIWKLYSLRDAKAEVFMAPQAFQNKAVALRAVAESVNGINKDSPIAKYPEDFGIYELGEFDDSTCRITLYDTPYHLANCFEFVKQE